MPARRTKRLRSCSGPSVCLATNSTSPISSSAPPAVVAAPRAAATRDRGRTRGVRPGAGVPGAHDVGRLAQDVRGVPAAHELLGGRRVGLARSATVRSTRHTAVRCRRGSHPPTVVPKAPPGTAARKPPLTRGGAGRVARPRGVHRAQRGPVMSRAASAARAAMPIGWRCAPARRGPRHAPLRAATQRTGIPSSSPSRSWRSAWGTAARSRAR